MHHHLNIIGDFKSGIIVIGAISIAMMIFTFFMMRRVAHADAAEPGVFGVFGAPGNGKSYFFAWLNFTAQKKKRTVLSTMRVEGATFISRDTHPDHLPVWIQFMDAPDGALILCDEAHNYFAADDLVSPQLFREWLTSLRHRKITFIWASQHPTFVLNILRKLTPSMWVCTKLRRGVFSYAQYPVNPVSYRISMKKSMARILLKLDSKIANTYDTYEEVHSDRAWSKEALEATRQAPSRTRRVTASGPALSTPSGVATTE